jgi:uncharacterized protein YecE (DUF72 family)
MADVRIGVCSWADEGLVKRWYPRSVRTPEARLRHYADRFETVEVDSPFYRLPAPETVAKWVERTPSGFVFHAKASKAMTGHEETDARERAFAEFRESLSMKEGRLSSCFSSTAASDGGCWVGFGSSLYRTLGG